MIKAPIRPLVPQYLPLVSPHLANTSAVTIGLMRGGIVAVALAAAGFGALAGTLPRFSDPVQRRLVVAYLVAAFSLFVVTSVVAGAQIGLERRGSSRAVRVLVPWWLGGFGLVAGMLNAIYAAAMWRGGTAAAVHDLSRMGPAAPGFTLVAAFGATTLVLGLGQRGWSPWEGRSREMAHVLACAWAGVFLAAVVVPDKTDLVGFAIGGVVIGAFFILVSMPAAWIIHLLARVGDRLTLRMLGTSDAAAQFFKGTDARLPDLERRWKVTGSVEDADNLAQVRRGIGDPDQLAWDGYEDFTILLGEVLPKAELLLEDTVQATEEKFGGPAEEARLAATKRHTATVHFECAHHAYRVLRAGGIEHGEAWTRAYAFVCAQIRRHFPAAPVGFFAATRNEGQTWWSVLHEEFRAEKWAYPAGVDERLPSN